MEIKEACDFYQFYLVYNVVVIFTNFILYIM